MLASAMEATGSRYIGESGALKYIGSELKLLDRKKVYILGGKRALEAALPKMEEALKEEKLDYKVGEFSGYCTYDNAGRHARELAAAGCDSIVGVGGGKCMDTAKIISKLCNVPLGMVPTQLGTCVSCTNMAIVYENNGAYLEAYHPDKAIAFILADFELLANSPVRYTAAGIVDAMAKFPERTLPKGEAMTARRQTMQHPRQLRQWQAAPGSCILPTEEEPAGTTGKRRPAAPLLQ